MVRYKFLASWFFDFFLLQARAPILVLIMDNARTENAYVTTAGLAVIALIRVLLITF